MLAVKTANLGPRLFVDACLNKGVVVCLFFSYPKPMNTPALVSLVDKLQVWRTVVVTLAVVKLSYPNFIAGGVLQLRY